MSPGVWAEQMKPSAIEPLLPALGSLGVRLHLAMPACRLGEPALAELTRRAASQGVETLAWLLLREADGYWIGKGNAALAKDAVRALVRWRDARGGPCLGGLSFDLEPPLERTEELRQLGRARRWRLLGLLRANLDRGRHEQARRELAEALDFARQAGLYRHAVTYPMVLDQAGSSTTLEDALDLLVSGLDWDEVSVMVYQTAFSQIAGHWLGPGLVHSYAASAARRWGERAGIDLGVVGSGGVALAPGHRYPSPESLHADVRAALAAGIPASRIRVYGLGGVAGEIGRWLDFRALQPKLPPRSARVTALRTLVRLVGRGLAFGRRAR